MMHIDDEANKLINKEIRKQLKSQGISCIEVPQKIVEEVFAKHGFRKSGMEIDTVNYANSLERETLPERIWINDSGGCIEIKNTVRVLYELDTRESSWQLPEEDQKKEGLCLITELEGIRLRESTIGWVMAKKCRKILEVIIEEGKESTKKTLSGIKEDILSQVAKGEIAKTIRDGKRHRTTFGQFIIGKEIEVLSLSVKIVVGV